jgi:pimeloyl-ACP methyl ester carboxylesterase
LRRWAAATVPTLILVGGRSPDWMQHGMRQLDQLLPNSQLRSLEGQTHMVKAGGLSGARGILRRTAT